MALAMAQVIAGEERARGGRHRWRATRRTQVAKDTGLTADQITALAAAFAAATPSLAVAGGVGAQHRGAIELCQAVNLLNEVAGNIGKTVRFGAEPAGERRLRRDPAALRPDGQGRVPGRAGPRRQSALHAAEERQVRRGVREGAVQGVHRGDSRRDRGGLRPDPAEPARARALGRPHAARRRHRPDAAGDRAGARRHAHRRRAAQGVEGVGGAGGGIQCADASRPISRASGRRRSRRRTSTTRGAKRSAAAASLRRRRRRSAEGCRAARVELHQAGLRRHRRLRLHAVSVDAVSRRPRRQQAVAARESRSGHQDHLAVVGRDPSRHGREARRARRRDRRTDVAARHAARAGLRLCRRPPRHVRHAARPGPHRVRSLRQGSRRQRARPARRRRWPGLPAVRRRRRCRSSAPATITRWRASTACRASSAAASSRRCRWRTPRRG